MVSQRVFCFVHPTCIIIVILINWLEFPDGTRRFILYAIDYMCVPHNDFHSVPTFNRCWSNGFFHLMYHLTLTSRLELPDGTGRYFYVHTLGLHVASLMYSPIFSTKI